MHTFYKKCAEAPRSFGTECLTFSASSNYYPYDVFISHAARDKGGSVNALCRGLKRGAAILPPLRQPMGV